MFAIIYKLNQYNAYRMDETGERFSLAPYGNNTEYYSGDDDGGFDYILPEGFEIARDVSGAIHIYNGDTVCPIGMEHDRPVIYFATENRCAIIPLKRYGIAELASDLGVHKSLLYAKAKKIQTSLGRTPTISEIKEEYERSKGQVGRPKKY